MSDRIGPDPATSDRNGPDRNGPIGTVPIGTVLVRSGSIPTAPDSISSDRNGPDPFGPAPIGPDPIRPDPIRPDPIRPDPIRPDRTAPGPDPIALEPALSDPIGPDRIGPDRIGSDPTALGIDPTTPDPATPDSTAPDPRASGAIRLRTPTQGRVTTVSAAVGKTAAAGEVLAVVEAMKMEHPLVAPGPCVVRGVYIAAGAEVRSGQAAIDLDLDEAADPTARPPPPPDLDAVRPDLQEALAARAQVLDNARPAAVAKRHRLGLRTARENLADLLDADSFVEFGALAVAAQRRRRSLEDLVQNTPADGIVTGVGTVNAALVGPDRARCAVMAYDYTVLAGTQGVFSHKKADRLIERAERWRLPVVLFAEGGGGRPGDTDWLGVAGLDCTTFQRYAALDGRVPRVGIVAGRCFAGNAALLGCSDIVIATADASVGMGGPAMIEGGGLGTVAPDAVGPARVLAEAGAIDVCVADEAAAVAAAKRVIGFFQGPIPPGEGAEPLPDPRALRHLVPEDRARVYDMREIVEGVADRGSVVELRRAFGRGLIAAFARIEGHPLGIVANDPRHLGGALDAPACDKLAWFFGLCGRPRPARGLAVRHAGLHGGPGVGGDGHGAPRLGGVRGRRPRARARDRGGRAPGLRARRPGDGRGGLRGPLRHRRVAVGGVRRDGHRRGGPPRVPPGARRCARGRPRPGARRARRRGPGAGPGAERGSPRRDRRRHRSRPDPAVAGPVPGGGARGRGGRLMWATTAVGWAGVSWRGSGSRSGQLTY